MRFECRVSQNCENVNCFVLLLVIREIESVVQKLYLNDWHACLLISERNVVVLVFQMQLLWDAQDHLDLTTIFCHSFGKEVMAATAYFLQSFSNVSCKKPHCYPQANFLSFGTSTVYYRVSVLVYANGWVLVLMVPARMFVDPICSCVVWNAPVVDFKRRPSRHSSKLALFHANTLCTNKALVMLVIEPNSGITTSTFMKRVCRCLRLRLKPWFNNHVETFCFGLADPINNPHQRELSNSTVDHLKLLLT